MQYGMSVNLPREIVRSHKLQSKKLVEAWDSWCDLCYPVTFFDIRPCKGNANLVIFKVKGNTNEDYNYDGWILKLQKFKYGP